MLSHSASQFAPKVTSSRGRNYFGSRWFVRFRGSFLFLWTIGTVHEITRSKHENRLPSKSTLEASSGQLVYSFGRGACMFASTSIDCGYQHSGEWCI